MSPIPGDNRQDPHDPNEDDLSIAAMETNIIIAAGSSSDSAGEDDGDELYQGYQMLPQDPAQVPDHEDEEEDITMETTTIGASGGNHSDTPLDTSLKHSIEENNFSSHLPSHLQTQASRDPDIMERKSLWSQTWLHPQEPMDQDHMNKIKSAMSGFSLPGCSIPEWAKVVPEQDWKSQLLTRLQGQVPIISPDPETEEHEGDSGSENIGGDPPNKRARCSVEEEDPGPEIEEGQVSAVAKGTLDDNKDNNNQSR